SVRRRWRVTPKTSVYVSTWTHYHFRQQKWWPGVLVLAQMDRALIAPARSQIVDHGVQCGGNLFSRGAQYAHGKAGSLGQRDAKQRLGLWVFRLIRRGQGADTLEGIGNFLAQFRYERSIDAGVHGQQGAQVGSPVHVQHGTDRCGLVIRADRSGEHTSELQSRFDI